MDYLAAHSAAQLHASFYDFSSSHISDNMSSPDHSAAHFLRMEDLQTPSASPPPSQHLLAHCTSSQQMHSSPAPVIVHSKAAKKRKSWGQELPQPKTNLPPRKRAKTDDEKEQRRIERIKRNRAAAHNSRERKRQEAEGLAVALAHANAELEAYRRLHGPLPADIVLPEVTVVTESADTPVPSLSDSRSSVDETGTAPSSPTDSLWHHTIIKQEPVDSLSTINLPPSFDSLDAKPSLLSLNPTQHSAAMLCDLPCRFNASSRSTRPSEWAANRWWATLFLSLHTLSMRSCYQTLLLALWTTMPSRMARSMPASPRSSSPSTITSTTPRLLQSTLRHLALYETATGPMRTATRRSPALSAESSDAIVRGSTGCAGLEQARTCSAAITALTVTELDNAKGHDFVNSNKRDGDGVGHRRDFA